MNRVTRRRRHRPTKPISPRTGLPLEPVGSLTAQQLHDELVADAVYGAATSLERAVEAYERIGRARGCGAEQAYQDVRQEVAALTGRGMPML